MYNFIGWVSKSGPTRGGGNSYFIYYLLAVRPFDTFPEFLVRPEPTRYGDWERKGRATDFQ